MIVVSNQMCIVCVCVVPLKAVRTAAGGADAAAGAISAAQTAGQFAPR